MDLGGAAAQRCPARLLRRKAGFFARPLGDDRAGQSHPAGAGVCAAAVAQGTPLALS
jgi:hypothetical protein